MSKPKKRLGEYMNNPKKLPKPEKKVVSKVLVEKDLSYRTVGSILGLSAATIMRYSREDIPDKLKQFETKIREAFEIKEQAVAAHALARMDDKLVSATLSEAMDVYKLMTGKGNTGPGIAIQQNSQVFPGITDEQLERILK